MKIKFNKILFKKFFMEKEDKCVGYITCYKDDFNLKYKFLTHPANPATHYSREENDYYLFINDLLMDDDFLEVLKYV